MEDKRAISILSGGIDSSVTTALAKSKGYILTAITFDYGQKHRIEIEYARKICKFLDIKDHIIFTIDIGSFGGSALTDKKIEIPTLSFPVAKKRKNKEAIPITYVPMRNLVFLSIATSLAEAKGISTIFFGANIVDYSGYPDCRPQFVRSFTKTANLASKNFHTTRRSFKILTPLINMSKVEIIKKGLALGLDFSLTYSCY
ncbi:MAG: 7-cyano-7-deazaguanine synthase QueC, partial [Planctomycetota bacterium]